MSPAADLTALTYANNIYIFGGYDGSNYLSDSQYSQISTADGSVGSWTYSTSLPQPLSQADGFAVNGYIYLIGGRSNATTCDPETLVTPVSANTTIGSGNDPTGVGEWYETNQRYTDPRYGNSAVYYNGKAYVIGGGLCSSISSPVTDSTSGAGTFVVPSGVTSITYKAWSGGGGGGGGGSAAAGGTGGGSGYINATMTVTPGETLNLYVGGGGGAGVRNTAGGGGGGGGYSSIYRGATALAVVAGGGGGGGGNSAAARTGGAGGAGGAAPGGASAGGTGTTVTGGSVGTTSGGAAGTGGANNGTAGTSLTGGLGANGTAGATDGGAANGGVATGGAAGSVTTTTYAAGGGGGSGWFGGGGGGGTNVAITSGGSGGGGGSSYTDPGDTSVTNTPGAAQSPGNSGDSDRGTAGGGGNAGASGGVGTAGSDGKILISFSAYPNTVIQQTALLSQPQVAKYSIMMDTDTDVFPNNWLLNGLDNSIGAAWQLKYRSMTNTTTLCKTPAMTTWGVETNFGDVQLMVYQEYTHHYDGSGVTTNCARFYYMNVTIDSSQAFGYPDDVSRGPTITDLTLQFTADPAKRLMHGRTFVGGLQMPDDTPYYTH
jgi:hypothetical protein